MTNKDASTLSIPRTSRNGLQLLREALETCHPVLVAIDFERTENLKDGFSHSQDCQVGIAVLDTRKLAQPDNIPDKLISTYNFASGSPKYTAKASRKFLFGDTTIIEPTDIVASIERAIPKQRNILLLGHGVLIELQILRTLGFTFPKAGFDVIDTFYVATEAMGTSGTLGYILTQLGCPFNKLHSGGNDAHFTLRASLLLATRNHPNQHHLVLAQIMTHPIPHRLDCHKRAAKKKEKRLARSRKHQSKTWDLETQERIRAERRAKKQAEAERNRVA